ncbi:uncharacterized protein PAC_05598 [Phialocephala subalpina]|uniref:Uncharacterized protein n=1 Tax=Phialocephala subalpina TaxID=576137 RepID=A0A1L7WSF7_9HELO|nr:uncharacterized protein PAC_05598 [Phialocephala subalpina]
MPPEAIHEIENPPRDRLEFYREYCGNTSQQLARAVKEVQIPGSTTLSKGRSTTPDYFGECSDESSVALGAELHQLATLALEKAKTEKQTSTSLSIRSFQGRVQKSRPFTRQFQPNLPEIQRLLDDQTSPTTAPPPSELPNFQIFVGNLGVVRPPTTAPPRPKPPNFQSLTKHLGVVTSPTTAAPPELLDVQTFTKDMEIVRNRTFSAIPALSLEDAQCLKIKEAYEPSRISPTDRNWGSPYQAMLVRAYLTGDSMEAIHGKCRHLVPGSAITYVEQYLRWGFPLPEHRGPWIERACQIVNDES